METDKMNGANIPCLRLPWTFLQVSCRWRRLTLSSPLLWIAINVRQCHNDRFPTLDAKWNSVIERSADCDLVVAIDDGTSWYNIPSMVESLHLLARTTMRWRKMNIHARHPVLGPLVGCSFDRLTDLVWDLSYLGAPKTEFQNSLNLRRLTVLGSAPLDVKWDQITDYSCNPAGFQYLPKLTAMEHFSMDLTPSPGASPYILLDRISLRSVRSMSMKQESNGGQSLRHISQFRLHLPSLNDLTIVFQGTAVPTLPTFPEPLLNLRRLILVSRAILGDISAFMARHDSIESLYTMNPHALGLLHVTPGCPIILTRLSVSAENFTLCAMTIIDVVESRCGDDIGHLARLVELEILGTEWVRQQAMEDILEGSKVLKRWNTVRGGSNRILF